MLTTFQPTDFEPDSAKSFTLLLRVKVKSNMFAFSEKSQVTNTKELGSCVKNACRKRQKQISDIAQTEKYSKEKGDYLNLVQAEHEASISGVRQKPISFS